MRRWNGWGDQAQDYPLNEVARGFLRERVGQGSANRDASLESVLAGVAPSRLANAPFLTDAASRAQHGGR